MTDTIAFCGDDWKLRTQLPVHKPLWLQDGIRVRIKEGRIDSVQASLPRVLYGHNGRVITSNDDMRRAADMLYAKLNTVAIMPPVDTWRVRRVDFACNFDLPAGQIITAHHAFNHPAIRNPPNLYRRDQGVSWRGAHSRIKVSFYDKSKEMRVPGSVLRAEVSIQGKVFNHKHPNVDLWDVQAGWSTLRGYLILFPPIDHPERATSLVQSVAYESAEVRARILGRCDCSAKTLRRWRERIEAHPMSFPKGFSWAEYLSVDAPAEVVAVEPRKLRKP